MAGLSRAERIKAIQQKLAELQAEEKRLELKRKAVFSKKERAAETRRKILIGALILDRVDRGEWPRDRLLAMLDAGLSRPDDRVLFGLPVESGGEGASSHAGGSGAMPDAVRDVGGGSASGGV